MTIGMQCDDGSTARGRLENFVFSLAQPAFGIAKSGTSEDAKAFSAGALVLESAFDFGGQH